MTCALIRDFGRLYVGSPETLESKYQEAEDGAVYFAMRGSIKDDSRLIGKDGIHVKALAFLVESVGRAQGRPHTFRLISHRERVEPWLNPRAAISYDPREARDVLCRWLTALGVEVFAVEVGPGLGARTNLSYIFNVKIADRAKAESLTATTGELSIIGAIGTLMRAVANNAGVKFQVQLADRIG